MLSKCKFPFIFSNRQRVFPSISFLFSMVSGQQTENLCICLVKVSGKQSLPDLLIWKAVGCRDFKSELWTQTSLGLKPSSSRSYVMSVMLFPTICQIGMMIHLLFEGMNVKCLAQVGIQHMPLPFSLFGKYLFNPSFPLCCTFHYDSSLMPWLWLGAPTGWFGFHQYQSSLLSFS